jgi:hypothetical protein
VTSTEAANYLGLSNYEDLDEAIEEQLFQCRQEIIQKADQVLLFPAKEKRCVTRLGFTPRRVTCCSVRSECPRSFTVGDARYTKDTHDSRLIITLASNLVIDAVPVIFTSP